MPLEDVHQVESTNWKAVAIAVVLIVLGSLFGTQLRFPYGWLMGSCLGIVGLYVGMKMRRTPLVKDFSRSINEPQVGISDHAEARVIRAAEKKDS